MGNAKKLLIIIVIGFTSGVCAGSNKDKSAMELEKIVVTQESFNSETPYDIVYSNIEYLNALFNEYVYKDEVSEQALMSYYVDYYLAQVNNGGFSQFVYNSRWNVLAVRHVRDGLRAMGATKNLELFNQSAGILDELGQVRIKEYLAGDYFGTNEERDILSAFDTKFFKMQEDEDLIEYNANWLKQHPKLLVLNSLDFRKNIEAVADSIPNIDERIQMAREAEPRYIKLIRALGEASGQQLDRVTAGSHMTYQGQQLIAWHFITDQGHHYMLDTGSKAMMFHGESEEQIAIIEAGSEYESQ